MSMDKLKIDHYVTWICPFMQNKMYAENAERHFKVTICDHAIYVISVQLSRFCEHENYLKPLVCKYEKYKQN